MVGAGARAEMFVRSLVSDHADRAELVALADPNPARIRAHNRWLEELGHAPVAAYHPDEFGAMLEKERVDSVIVTSVDRTHVTYVLAALQAGRSVISEKPMTTTAEYCQQILRAAREARERSGATMSVSFNYRYNPVHERVRQVLASGVLGRVGSVHFEWLLDVRHGADYFRRWHRDRLNSGGLLVHKASHHFDLVNWWLSVRPVRVYAHNQLFFYGSDAAGVEHGYARGYDRAHGAADAEDDPFALDLSANPRMRELYLQAEAEDGYIRDRNVFAPGVSIDDDMAVLVQYDTGATMTYHLNAYAPYEGYRFVVNAARGRLELEVVENDYVDPVAARTVKGGPGSQKATVTIHGVNAAVESGHTRVSVHPFWSPSYDVDLPPLERGGHGGGDARMTADLFSGAAEVVDPLGRRATERDGALALLTGLAANASAASGRAVDVAELIDPELLRD
jgi:predicted dehydrogenase